MGGFVMLVLSRKCDQEIVVNGNIRIRIVAISGKTVRVGIDAPKDVNILRGELVATEDSNLEIDSSSLGQSTVVPECEQLNLSVDFSEIGT